MKTLKDQHFWPSYVDLMTSLFFIVLVLFVISFTLYQKDIAEVKVRAYEAEKIKEIRQTLDALMQNRDLFIYEDKYKRYRLTQNIKFLVGQYEITPSTILDYSSTVQKLKEVGNKLKEMVEGLKLRKETDSTIQNISYLMIIAGRASRDSFPDNYVLSYRRALALHNFWKDNMGIDFDSQKYHDIIDLQISGNGIGGIGRDQYNESNNQSFLIQIVPKISELKTE